MEQIRLSREILDSDDFSKRKKGTVHIKNYYIPFEMLPYCASNEKSFKKIMKFQTELYNNKSNVEDQIFIFMGEEIKWIIE